MSAEELPELPPDVSELLSEERSIPALANTDVARMRARLSAAVDAPSTPSVPGGGSGLGGHVLTFALGVAIGGAAGIAATLSWLDDAGEEAVREAPALVEATPQAEPRATLAPPVVPVADVAPAPPARLVQPREAPSTPDRLARERRMLDAARTAIANGHTDEGLSVLQRHAREFETGALAEERDALWIRALLELGRADEARVHAAGFRATYPNSLLWPGIAARLRRAPGREEASPTPE